MSESPQSDCVQSPVSSLRSRRWIGGVSIGVILAMSIWGVVSLFQMEKGYSRGSTLLRQRREMEAERELDRYLWLHPGDPEAILLWAEAVISGESRPPQDAARLAIERLNDIPDSSILGAEARMRQGRLALLILHQPDRAEKLLNRSAELAPDIPDTHYLLWKLFDLTERFYHSEPHFWRTFELTSDELKSQRLRDWYLSQFSPNTANSELDRRMGFLQPGEFPGDPVDLARMETFLSNEPQSPMVVAAMARWLLHTRDRDEALRLLMEISSNEDAVKNPYYLSALVTVLIDLGKLDDAQKHFAHWPKPFEGFLYWNTAGRVLEVIDRDDRAAVASYDKALSIWPGPAEWSIMHRKAQCLARMGDRAAADEVRTQAKRIELLMETEVHRKLRLAMADLQSRESLRHIVDFYEMMHREREAKCWQDAIDRLPSESSRVYSGR